MNEQTRGSLFQGKATPSVSPKKNHLFVIGIDKYAHLEERYQLSNAKRDAEAVKNILTNEYQFASFVELYDKNTN